MKIRPQTLSKTSTILTMFIAGLVLFAFASYVWLNTAYVKPETVFWAAIDNSLRTSSVNRQAIVDNGVERTVQDQTLIFDLDPRVFNQVNITRASTEEGVAPDSVKLRTQGYPNEDFLIYDEIVIKDSNENLQQAVGVWSNLVASDDESQTQPQLFNESLLGSFVMFGNFDKQTRNDILDLLKLSAAYTVDFDNVNEQEVTVATDPAGNNITKNVYVYDVKISLAEFKPALVYYLRELGQEKLATEIESSPASNTAEAKLMIDPVSRNVIKVDLNGSSETFTGYGLYYESERPQAVMTQSQLNELLSN